MIVIDRHYYLIEAVYRGRGNVPYKNFRPPKQYLSLEEAIEAARSKKDIVYIVPDMTMQIVEVTEIREDIIIPITQVSGK